MTSEGCMDNVDGNRSRLPNLGSISNEQRNSVASAGDTTGPYADCYKMDHSRRGKFILINNKKFLSNTGMEERTGTDVDASNLMYLFKKLGFEVKRYDDLTTIEMLNIMIAVGKEDHHDCDCFAVAVLSHGMQGKLFGVDGTISVENFIVPIKKCLSLAGKPKLYFIQACSGSKSDDGVEVEQDSDREEPRDNLARIPQAADFLFAYSAAPGYVAWRNSNKGSWFIQALYRVLTNPAFKDLDLLRILTRVNKAVAYDFETDMTRKKQVPHIVSQLTKDLYFSKK